MKLASSGEQNRGRCVDSAVLRGALHASLLQHCFEEADRPCSELMDAIVDEAMQRCAEGYGERLEKGLAVVCYSMTCKLFTFTFTFTCFNGQSFQGF